MSPLPPTKMHVTVPSGTAWWGQRALTWSCCSSLMLPSHWPINSRIWFSCFCCCSCLSVFCRFSSCSVNWRRTELSWKGRKNKRWWGCFGAFSYLFDPLPLFAGADCWVDADALLEDGQTGLCLAALDLRQPALLLLLPRFQILDHPLVVALHVFQLLRQQKMEREMKVDARFKPNRGLQRRPTFSCFFTSWCLWRKNWSLSCCFNSWCLSWRFFSSMSQIVDSRSNNTGKKKNIFHIQKHMGDGWGEKKPWFFHGTIMLPLIKWCFLSRHSRSIPAISRLLLEMIFSRVVSRWVFWSDKNFLS